MRTEKSKLKTENQKSSSSQGRDGDKGSNTFRQIIEIGKRLIAEQEIEKILANAMDMAIDLSRAERGMILLFADDKSISFETARKLNKADIEHPEFEISRTIIGKVRQTGAPVFLRNALDDPSLGKSNSVARLQILSVICLPLQFQENLFGAIYLDNRSALGVFKEAIFLFIQEFADFISLAAYNALERKRLKNHVNKLEEELRRRYCFESIIGHHPKMVEVLKLVSQVADIDATVLIQGESGTGKELIARALHFNGSRKQKAFVPINCGAIPENLLESELFGHVRGAFTGAIKDKAGWFERADGGTIFLDEVGEMSSALQVKLLRVLQSGEYNPVGSSNIRYCDVRIVAATIRNLKELAAENRFREDLYYRLNIIDINLPPLRERISDIPILAQYFLKTFGERYNKPTLRIAGDTEAMLLAHDYPGNVRELENIIQRAVALAEGERIEPIHLPAELCRQDGQFISPKRPSGFKLARQNVLEKFERDYVTECLRAANGNISQAAKIAGIQFANFHAKVKKYGIETSNFKEGQKD